VSSESGSLTVIGGRTPAYSVSKAALNALSRMLADELRASHILVNSVCPGWVATEMGGPMHRDQSRKALQVSSGRRRCLTTGGFFRDGEPLAW
jgi:NAD(P)-dependent dehydrogenase (short-subunit alcohol dehydrogenase family)